MLRHSAVHRLLVAGALGAVVAGILAIWTPWQVWSLTGWNAAGAAYIGSVWLAIRRADSETTARIAMREDASRSAADIVLIAASVSSLAGVASALTKASHETGIFEALTTATAVVGVVLSWTAVHTVFTLRYAHLYYRDDGGIDFHSDRRPDYGDFAYVAFTLGMTYQVSDTDLSSRAMRVTATRHAVLSFVFGIFIIATTINVLATLLAR